MIVRSIVIVAVLTAATSGRQQQKQDQDDFAMLRAEVNAHVQDAQTGFELLLRQSRLTQDQHFELLVLVPMPPESAALMPRKAIGNGFNHHREWPGAITTDLDSGVEEAGPAVYGVYREQATGTLYLAWSVPLVAKEIGNHTIKVKPTNSPLPEKKVRINVVSFWPPHLTRAILLALFMIGCAVTAVVPRIPAVFAAVAVAVIGWSSLPSTWSQTAAGALAVMVLCVLVAKRSFLELAFERNAIPIMFPPWLLRLLKRKPKDAAKPTADEQEVPPPVAEPPAEPLVLTQIETFRMRSQQVLIATLHRARWQLVVGLATGFSAVVFLVAATAPISTAIVRSPEPAAAMPVVVGVIPYVLGFSCLVVTAAFLVRQYRSTLDDARHFEAALRLRESQAAAMGLAHELTGEAAVKKKIEILAWPEKPSEKSTKDSETSGETPKPNA